MLYINKLRNYIHQKLLTVGESILSPDEFKTFIKRNIERYIENSVYEEKVDTSALFYDEYRALRILKSKLSFLLTKKINIPQVEFTLTTQCTLKCKDCWPYISYLKPDEKSGISIDDFKKQVRNLTNAVNKIRILILTGGESFLVKNIKEYIEFAAQNKKIQKIYIYTNGTIVINNDNLDTIKKYRNKIEIFISNYSKNPDLENILHCEEIIKQLSDNNINYTYESDFEWYHCSPLPEEKRRNRDLAYFSKCTEPCVAVFNGKMVVCPRAGTFALKNIYELTKDEYVDLQNTSDPKIMAQKLIEFYSRNYFTVCDYCSLLEDSYKIANTPGMQM